MGTLEQNIEITKNEYNFNLSDLVLLGYTPKKERMFYLLNKLVGNHLEVKPNVIRATGYLLADLIYNTNHFNHDLLLNYIKGNISDEDMLNLEFEKYIETDEKLFIIGLSESATAIGMATAGAIKNSYYISTSRENPIKMDSLFEFQEQHFSITSHKCFLKNTEHFKNADRIVIVEDEITTGNTLLNLIKSIKDLTNAKNFTLVSILNFSDNILKDNIKKLHDLYGINIEVNSILYGKLDYNSLNIPSIEINDIKEDSIAETTDLLNIDIFSKSKHQLKNNKYMEFANSSGIFGVSFNEIRNIENQAKELSAKINTNNEEKILVIGHGENIYLPSRIAYYINNNSTFKSTTKSFIVALSHDDYPIHQRSKFSTNDSDYYLYNKNFIERYYDKVYFIVDFDINIKLTSNSETIKI